MVRLDTRSQTQTERSWIVPAAVSTSDEKVVQMRSELAAQQNNRDKIAADLTSIDKAILAERAFQNEYAKAIAADVDGRRASLEKVRELAGTAASTRTEIRSANDEFSTEEQKRAAEEYKAGLIDRNGMIAHKQQMAGLATANLGLAEKQADYERQAQELELQTNALDGLIKREAEWQRAIVSGDGPVDRWSLSLGSRVWNATRGLAVSADAVAHHAAARPLPRD